MTLRIAIALHDFSLGGTERIAIRLGNQWVADGAEVFVLAGSERGELRGMLDPRVGLIVASPSIPRTWRSVDRLGQWVRGALQRRAVDVLFVPGNYHWPIAGAVRGMDSGTRPLVVAQVSNVLRKPQRGKLGQQLFEARIRGLLRGVDAVVTMAEEDRLLANAILRRSDCRTIPLPALGADPWPPSPIDPHSRLIVAAGRFVAQKAFDVLVDAFAIVARHDDQARLLLLGDGVKRQALHKRIAALGLAAKVDMPGFVEDIRPALDAARLFVLSSRFEGYGAVIVEALAAGRPVVSTASTPAATALLGTCAAGRVVPIENPPALARAMIAEIEGPAPDAMALATLVTSYRIDEVARRYTSLFTELSVGRKRH